MHTRLFPRVVAAVLAALISLVLIDQVATMGMSPVIEALDAGIDVAWATTRLA